jgi:DNA-binding LacI/PurR family transcriptional regulator
MTSTSANTSGFLNAANDVGVDVHFLERNEMGTISRKHIDVIVEWGMDEETASLVGTQARIARIPTITIDTPAPNAFFLGSDHYGMGIDSGLVLAQHAVSTWGREFDVVVTLGTVHTCERERAYLAGASEAIRTAFPHWRKISLLRVNTCDKRRVSKKAMITILDQFPGARGIGVIAATDQIALGVTDAARENNRIGQVAVVWKGCIAEALLEMQRPFTCLIASASPKTCDYGIHIIRLAISLSHGVITYPYTYVRHQILGRGSLSE